MKTNRKIMMSLLKVVTCGCLMMLISGWGFFAHRKINRLAVFTLPVEMSAFYKKNISYLEEAAVNPDRRRYSDPEEGPRHYIDLDDYKKERLDSLPTYWDKAVEKYGEDSLKMRGILPWHLNRMYFRLKEAFQLGDPSRIIRTSAELGHYLADAHVPLHTTSNHDGQKTGQVGIHGFWESRLPELFFTGYDFFVGRATYIENIQEAAWRIVGESSAAVDSVLQFEKELSNKREESKYSFETKGRLTVKVFSATYSEEYHRMLSGMVERRMRASVKRIGDFWFTAWVDAGQPDLTRLIYYQPTEQELKQRAEELARWKEEKVKAREHERENQ